MWSLQLAVKLTLKVLVAFLLVLERDEWEEELKDLIRINLSGVLCCQEAQNSKCSKWAFACALFTWWVDCFEILDRLSRSEWRK